MTIPRTNPVKKSTNLLYLAHSTLCFAPPPDLPAFFVLSSRAGACRQGRAIKWLYRRAWLGLNNSNKYQLFLIHSHSLHLRVSAELKFSLVTPTYFSLTCTPHMSLIPLTFIPYLYFKLNIHLWIMNWYIILICISCQKTVRFVMVRMFLTIYCAERV